MRELIFEELTTEQKLGLVTIGYLRTATCEDQLDYILELVKKRSIGAVWVDAGPEIIAQIKEAADYPILIMTDAEDGIGGFNAGRHNAIAQTGSEELAYVFGKVTALEGRRRGYNVICNPVLDMTSVNTVCGMNTRSLGHDKEEVTKYARQIARAMHDCGVLTVGKHYPGVSENEITLDSHFAETESKMSREELIDYNLYPYIKLSEEGLLDGIMTKHSRFSNIDPIYPASLSKELIGIIREAGFGGFSITDALVMHGVTAKFGEKECIPLSISGGNDIALAFNSDNRFSFEAMKEGYEKGVISDERLDEAVRRVLEAQHKVMAEPKYTELTDKDIEDFKRLSTDGIYAITDEGLDYTLPKDGRHYFVILTDHETNLAADKIALDTFSHFWHSPADIAERIRLRFPNSEVDTLQQFPTISNNMHIMSGHGKFDDVVFVSFFFGRPGMGRECLTSRVLTVLDSLQVTNRIAAVVHCGNPFVLEDFPHVPRIIVGPGSKQATLTTIDVLAGDYPAKGKPVYDVKLK